MKEELYDGDEEKTLSRLIFSLNLCGHKSYGKRAVRLAETEYKIETPPVFDLKKESLLVQLYQCLTEIACRLSDVRETRLKQYVADTVFNGINHRSRDVDSILSLFGLLIHEKKITEDDQMTLARAFAVIGAHECFKFLMKYRKNNDLSTAEYYAKNPGISYMSVFYRKYKHIIQKV